MMFGTIFECSLDYKKLTNVFKGVQEAPWYVPYHATNKQNQAYHDVFCGVL